MSLEDAWVLFFSRLQHAGVKGAAVKNKDDRSEQAASSPNALRPGPAQAGQELRKRAEELAQEQTLDTIEALLPEENRQTVHELRVHQIELTIQTEELHRAQAELDAESTKNGKNICHIMHKRHR